MSVDFFDVVVLDTNFFISLLTARVENEIIPNLNKIAANIDIEIVVPAEIPKSDIPGKFRILRQLIPKHVHCEFVNRNGSFWKKTRVYAMRERMVRGDQDPADIDVAVLAKKYAVKGGDRVVVVSDDVGVARLLKEGKPFYGIEHLSCGSFISILAASVKDEKLRKILDLAVKRVFQASWNYRKKTRQYIDINMLVEDLTDTARFVRSAAKMGSSDALTSTYLKPIHTETVIESDSIPKPMEPTNALMEAQELTVKARNTREQNNVHEAEKIIYEISMKSSQLIYSIEELEQRVIIERFLKSELFEHHSWLLTYRLQHKEILDALIHSEAILIYMNTISVGPEAIENLLALQGLLYLLLGESKKALDLFREIPKDDDELSPTQLIAIVISLILSGNEKEALTTIKKNKKEYFDGLITSMHTYSNDLYNYNQHTMAISLLKFITINFGTSNKEITHDSVKRLFILTRTRVNLINKDKKLLSIFKTVLGKKSDDFTKRAIPREWIKKLPVPLKIGKKDSLKGAYHILDKEINENDNTIDLVAWNEENSSVWRLIISYDYYPAIKDSFKIIITSGTVKSILKPRRGDICRGIIKIDTPTIQPELVMFDYE